MATTAKSESVTCSRVNTLGKENHSQQKLQPAITNDNSDDKKPPAKESIQKANESLKPIRSHEHFNLDRPAKKAKESNNKNSAQGLVEASADIQDQNNQSTYNPNPTSTSNQTEGGKSPISHHSATLTERRPPQHSVSINNLSDRQYCCVWWVEVYEDGYRPDLARALLAKVARHVNPILRDRGWRVKRLIESASPKHLGVCVTNGRGDADAASANIQLNLRQQPHKACRQFRSFAQVLSVMLHEITHISIGLEDIHPPCFWELLDEIKNYLTDKWQRNRMTMVARRPS